MNKNQKINKYKESHLTQTRGDKRAFYFSIRCEDDGYLVISTSSDFHTKVYVLFLRRLQFFSGQMWRGAVMGRAQNWV